MLKTAMPTFTKCIHNGPPAEAEVVFFQNVYLGSRVSRNGRSGVGNTLLEIACVDSLRFHEGTGEKHCLEV
jgi:hypothetical protein